MLRGKSLLWEHIVRCVRPSRQETNPDSASLFSRSVFSLGLALIWLTFAAGCSSSKLTSPSQPGSPTGFTNASLKGNYTYTLGGYSTVNNASFVRSGTFIADGDGHITSGADDLVLAGNLVSTMTTGSYAIVNDGTGLLTLNMTGAGQIELAVTLGLDGRVLLIGFDASEGGAGRATPQSVSAIANTPSGTYVFRLHSFRPGAASGGSISTVGSMTLTSGSINGNEDLVRFGTFGSVTITGLVMAPDSTGRGTLTLTDNVGFVTNYIYYVIDAATLDLLETDPGRIGSGIAAAQTGGPFGDASLKDSFVFHSRGDTLSNLGGTNSAGVFTSEGNGSLTAGAYDTAQDGVPTQNATLKGTYNVAANGRMAIALNPTLGSQSLAAIQQVAWIVSPSQALFLVDAPSVAEDGQMDQQQEATYSNASLNGSFSFVMFGYDTESPIEVDRLGAMNFNGSSTINLSNYFVNRLGSRNQTKASGKYSVSANGRVSGTISGVTSDLVIYLTSPTSGSILLEDAGTEVSGSIVQPVAP
jgi:hypothetical protein